MHYKNYHLVGIQGVGMSAVALILSDMGKSVTGSDSGEEYMTASFLVQRNIRLNNSFKQKHVQLAECVIYTGAHNGIKNTEVQEAIQKGIPVYSLAQFVGELTNMQQTISICGCHGKTTTTALAVIAAEALDRPVSHFVGGPGFGKYGPGAWKESGLFVVESDEYVADPISDRVPRLAYLHPFAILCTNIDFDHPDIYSSLKEIEDVYCDFFRKLPVNNALVICGDDARLIAVAKRSGHSFVSYGISHGNDFVLKGTFLSSKQLDEEIHISSGLIGQHNLLNAAGVIALYQTLGYDTEPLAVAFQKFSGVRRRQEVVFQNDRIVLMDDYGHHPAEIKATISAVRDTFPNHYIAVLFQPHTFSRTLSLKDDFVDALSTADSAFILPIFGSARESVTESTISSEDLIRSAHKKGYLNIEMVNSDKEITANYQLLATNNSRLVVVTMGAGDVYKKMDILKVLIS